MCFERVETWLLSIIIRGQLSSNEQIPSLRVLCTHRHNNRNDSCQMTHRWNPATALCDVIWGRPHVEEGCKYTQTRQKKSFHVNTTSICESTDVVKIRDKSRLRTELQEEQQWWESHSHAYWVDFKDKAKQLFSRNISALHSLLCIYSKLLMISEKA